MVPIGFVNVMGTAVWVTFVPRTSAVAQVVSGALFVLAVVIVAYFGSRVRTNLSRPRPRCP